MKLVPATPADAAAIAQLRNATAEGLTARFGRGHWSRSVTEGSVLRDLATSRVFVAWQRAHIVATLRLAEPCDDVRRGNSPRRLATKKPWAIDRAYFTTCETPLYLHDLAVAPRRQRRGIGRRCVEEAAAIARAWPSDAIRLDAYDAEAGAGRFYAKCGFREVGRVAYRGIPLLYYEMLL